MKIALLGYGKMGKEIEKISFSRGHSVVIKMDEHNVKQTGKMELSGADVAIEFSTPQTACDNILKCFEANIPVVVGTTGWYEKLGEISKQCNAGGHALFYASNFSIGVNLFFRLNEQLALMMNSQNGYESSIEEVHHIHKKDAPSGTAITLAEGLLKHSKNKKKWINKASTDPDSLSIISIREDEVPGTHTVKYSSTIDEIEIRHTAHNRQGFALGAVLAAEWIKGKKGIFGMQDLLSF